MGLKRAINYKLEPDPEDSISIKVVHRIFAMALKGVGCKEIARDLNREGLSPAPGNAGERLRFIRYSTTKHIAALLFSEVGPVTRHSVAVSRRCVSKMPGRPFLAKKLSSKSSR